MSQIPIPQADFGEVLHLIQSGQRKLVLQANTVLLETYWQVGAYLSRKVVDGGWGKGVVKDLVAWLNKEAPEAKGFSVSNLWRMKQFYEVYSADQKRAALPRVLTWTHYRILMAQCKSADENLFYSRSALQLRWSTRELEQQITRGAFERTMLADAKLTPALKEFPQDASGVFKDSYLIDFAGLTEPYLLFYHRDLQCLVAFELKTGDFEPAHLGQLNFYLEALDRQEKRPHENPSIGVLLCRSKDDEVVEMAMNRSLSPALVAEYETQLIPKALLKLKLHEWGELFGQREEEDL